MVYVDVRVNVGDIRHPHDARVRHVDIRKVARAHVIRGNEDVTRAEGKPRHSGQSAAERDRNAEAASADEADEGGRVHRPHHDGSGDPAPRSADERPAPVMERREAPWLCVNPGPAPRRDINPVADLIGSPAGGDTIGHPHCAIVRIVVPRAIVVQVVIAVDIARDVFGRKRRVFALIARLAPVFEIVVARRVRRVVGNIVGTVEGVHLSRDEIPCLSAAGDFTPAFANGDHGRAAIRIGGDAIFAAAREREREIGRIDFKRITGRKPAHVNFDHALRELYLRGAIVEREKRNAGLAGHADRGAADVNLAARIFIDPEVIARGEWAIGIGLHPVRVAGDLIGHRALNEIQPTHAARRIILRLILRQRGFRQ